MNKEPRSIVGISPIPGRKRLALCIIDNDTNEAEIVAYFVSKDAADRMFAIVAPGQRIGECHHAIN